MQFGGVFAMSLLLIIICLLLFLLWVAWINHTYPEIRNKESKNKNPYSCGSSILFFLTFLLSLLLASIYPNSEISKTTFILTLFLGFIAIFTFRVYSTHCKKAFHTTFISGLMLSILVLLLEFTSILLFI
jgi:hypothetical protein